MAFFPPIPLIRRNVIVNSLRDCGATSEATNSDNELFGVERMLRALRDSENGTPEEIINAVRKAVDDFTGDAEQFDDLTMLCMEYKGPEC